MPITKREEELASELVGKLQQRGKSVKRPVRVTPEVMQALQRSMQMRMTMNFDNCQVHLIEDEKAPASIDDGITEASGEEASMMRGLPCTDCGGRTVYLDDGDCMCTKCRLVQTPTDKPRPESNIILASERAQLTKHRPKRR